MTNISKLVNARKIVNFIENEDSFILISNKSCYYSHHIGAVIVDSVLQAGLNYKTVVAPRVNNLVNNFPEEVSLSHFIRLIEENKLEAIIKWNHPQKLERIWSVIDFCNKHQIETSEELLDFLVKPQNKPKFLSIKGIGFKTYDYILNLLNADVVAVDRHVFKFVENLGLPSNNYENVKTMIEYAADLMNIPRNVIDYSIWTYMSTDKVVQYRLGIS